MSSITLLLSLFACVGPWSSEQNQARDFQLANGHEGWVVIEYGVDGAGTPPLVDGRPLIRVPLGGQTQISTPYVSGIRNDQYRFKDGSTAATLAGERLSRSAEHAATRTSPFVCCGGTRTHEDISAQSPKRFFEYFYVGKGPAGETPSIP